MSTTQAIVALDAENERLRIQLTQAIADRDELAAESEGCHALLDKDLGLDDGGSTVAADTLEDRLTAYIQGWADKFSDVCAELHDASAELATAREALRVLRAERDEAVQRLAAVSLDLVNVRREREEARDRRDFARKQWDAATDELAALRTLAEQANRGVTIEERQLAASLIVARLVRPATDHQHDDGDDASCAECVKDGAR